MALGGAWNAATSAAWRTNASTLASVDSVPDEGCEISVLPLAGAVQPPDGMGRTGETLKMSPLLCSVVGDISARGRISSEPTPAGALAGKLRGESDDEGDAMLEDMKMILSEGFDLGVEASAGSRGSTSWGPGSDLASSSRADTTALAQLPSDGYGGISNGGSDGRSMDVSGQTSVVVRETDDRATICLQSASNHSSASASIKLRTGPPLPTPSLLQLWQRQAGRCAGCREPVPEPSVVGHQAQAATSPQLPEAPVEPSRGGVQFPPRDSQFPSPSPWASAVGILSRAAGGSLLSTTSASGEGARHCHYTGALYCPHCHALQTAVLPSSVLHHWNFVPKPVCCVAFDYLQAIHHQPLLCVTAINPGLYAK